MLFLNFLPSLLKLTIKSVDIFFVILLLPKQLLKCHINRKKDIAKILSTRLLFHNILATADKYLFI